MNDSILLVFKCFLCGLGGIFLTLYLMHFETKLTYFIQGGRFRDRLHIRGIFFPLILFLTLFKGYWVSPKTPHKFLYFLLPIFLSGVACGMIFLFPLGPDTIFKGSSYGLLGIFVCSQILVFLTILIGGVSQTQESMYGMIRLFCRFMASSLLFFLVIMTVILWSGSMDLSRIVEEQRSHWFVWPLFPCCVMYFMMALMRGMRPPFGMLEGGLDGLGGYKSYYVGRLLVMLRVSEYLYFLILISLGVLLFFGGWLPLGDGYSCSPFFWFFLKFFILFVALSLFTATLPNLRPDQFVRFNFKFLIPLSCGFLLLYSFIKGILSF